MQIDAIGFDTLHSLNNVKQRIWISDRFSKINYYFYNRIEVTPPSMQLQQTAFDYHLDYISDQIQVATGVGQSENMLISIATKRNAQRPCVVCVNTPRRPKNGTDSRYECTECNVGLYF
jgi:hypothetical protein